MKRTRLSIFLLLSLCGCEPEPINSQKPIGYHNYVEDTYGLAKSDAYSNFEEDEDDDDDDDWEDNTVGIAAGLAATTNIK